MQGTTEIRWCDARWVPRGLFKSYSKAGSLSITSAYHFACFSYIPCYVPNPHRLPPIECWGARRNVSEFPYLLRILSDTLERPPTSTSRWWDCVSSSEEGRQVYGNEDVAPAYCQNGIGMRNRIESPRTTQLNQQAPPKACTAWTFSIRFHKSFCKIYIYFLECISGLYFLNGVLSKLTWLSTPFRQRLARKPL